MPSIANTLTPVEPLDPRRKRLIFRAWHRGTREMDILLGSFADQYVPSFNDAQLDEFEELLEQSDPDLYDWYSGKAAPVSSNEMLTLFLSFRLPEIH